MPRPLLFVACDLDRNIFRTADLENAFLWILGEEFGIEPEILRQEIADNTTDAEGFDLFGYLKSSREIDPAGLKLLLRGQLLAPRFAESKAANYVRRRRKETLGKRPDPDPFTSSFLFDGAIELLQRWHNDPYVIPWIITTGAKEYQLFKLDILLASAGLHQMPYRILPENKGDFLVRLWRDGIIRTPDGVVVDTALVLDDRSSVHERLASLPSRLVNLVHVLRPGAKYPTPAEYDNVTVVDSLQALL